MKDFIIKKCINYIKKYRSCSNDDIEIIKYGLEGIYLSITKVVVILVLSSLLSIFKEVVIFLLLFNTIRFTAFGLHATKSYICLISSLLIFILIPYISTYISINMYIKVLISILCILYIYIYAPSDTKKRPIVNRKRRLIYKTISTLISIIYSFISILIRNNFISNALLFYMLVECFLISPIVYRIFKLPYNNYIAFLKNNPNFEY